VGERINACTLQKRVETRERRTSIFFLTWLAFSCNFYFSVDVEG
jgi:hypothetical protein